MGDEAARIVGQKINGAIPGILRARGIIEMIDKSHHAQIFMAAEIGKSFFNVYFRV